uniref:Uncharacterized protein n=1 Tax=Branchiostoma floridae TaxID=7739 RepID=C3ZL71_BRAFL|eukprot:XP_002590742.1 hypothetical protein BRAFLDRAFT_78156 [Branchiostoma floridae]
MLTFVTTFFDGDPEDDRRDSDCRDCCDSLQKELWKLFSRAPSRARAVLTSGRESTAEVETAQVVTGRTSRCGAVIGQNKSQDDRRDSDCRDCCDSLQKELWKLFSRAPSRARAVLTSGREWTAEKTTEGTAIAATAVILCRRNFGNCFPALPAALVLFSRQDGSRLLRWKLRKSSPVGPVDVGL